MQLRFLSNLIAAAAVAVVLSGCEPRAIGHAVVLWGPDGGPANGALLPVVERSGIDETLTLWMAEEKQRAPLENWRVREFRRRDDAERFQAAYEPYRDTYVFTDRSDGLPIREQPDTQSTRIYRVAPAQLLKVLGRGSSKATEGQLEAYWYEVLTDDGYSGHCFGYYLRVFEAPQAEARERMAVLLTEDPELDTLLSDVWRPEYFAGMVASNRVDLHRFAPEVGLFPDRASRQWRLELPDFSETLTYDRIENPAAGVYTFPPSTLRIALYAGERIEVSYQREGKTTRTVFVRLAADVEEVIERERDRRKSLLESFLANGSSLSSTAYGSLSFEADGRFRWSGFARVPAGVFLRTVAGSGRIDFPLRLAAPLDASYQGAVSFIFDEYLSGEQTVFLYSFVSSGLQLTRVLPGDVADLEVKRVSSSPLVMYFTPQER